METIAPSAFNQAITEQRLIHGAIKAAGVYRTHTDYEDFVQEAILCYAEVYTQNHHLGLTTVNKLAFRKIIWQITDQLRKQKRQTEHQIALDDELLQMIDADKADLWLLFEQLQESLPTVQRLILQKHLLAGVPLKELVAPSQKSERTLRREKQQLLVRLQKSLH